MVRDTINAIGEAEAEAAAKITAALEQGKTVVDAARQQAEQLKEETERGVKDKASEVNGALLQKGYAYLSQSVEEADAEIAVLKENAEKKADEAVEMIISQLV